ncbi:MAG: stage II sporulation protein R [Clostridiales bacterium]|jgi:stage II sporulation protein R|nr:stage II sporulation protein R [Clostridiales bacterium]
MFNILRICRNFWFWLKKDWKIIFASVCSGLLITGALAYRDAYAAQRGVAGSLIRFHVRASSDTAADQARKLAVRDAVLAEYGGRLEACGNIDEARAFLSARTGEIEELAEAELRARGSLHEVRAYLGTDYFPTREYGGIALPAGYYETLRIDIGSGRGANWWCIMFPPLCYVDITKEELSEKTKERLKTVMTDSGYDLIAEGKAEDGRMPLKIKFKLIELWQRRGQQPPETEAPPAGGAAEVPVTPSEAPVLAEVPVPRG